MKNSKKILSLALTLAMILSAVFCTGAVASADDSQYTASDARNLKQVTVAEDYDFSSLGTNLALDPTVSKFNSDGTYDTANGMKNAYSASSVFISPDNNTATSHTQDDSGVVYMKKGQRTIKIADTLETKSYYLITFFIKCDDAAGTLVRHWFADWTRLDDKDMSYYSTNWQRFSYIVYTGNKTAWSAIEINSNTAVHLDDFAVYKLSPTVGGESTNAGTLLAEDDIKYASSDTRSVKLVSIPKDYDFETLGTNLALDPTVSKFSAGAYDTTNGMICDYGGTNAIFVSPDSDVAKSRTADGSGVVYYSSSSGQPALKIAPSFETYSYYLVTFYIKCGTSAGTDIRTWRSVSAWEYEKVTDTTSTDWEKVSLIVYTGSKTSLGSIGLYQHSPVYLDDFAVYKLTSGVGGRSFAAGVLLGGPQFPGTKITAEENSTVTLDVARGYFVPHGAFATANGTIAEKQADGTFKVSAAGTYNYTQFKYPAGVVGTFGASIKDGDDTAESDADKSGIQFGSLITDNLSVEDSGTLVIRGKFDEFCATLPTYSRERILKNFYNRLTQNVEAGVPVRFSNAGKSVDVMYVPRTTYMWKNSANTELQYAVRVFGIKTAYADTAYTAVGYVTKDSAVTFSSEIKTATFSGLN